jgi:hypothetical protein
VNLALEGASGLDYDRRFALRENLTSLPLVRQQRLEAVPKKATDRHG